MVSEQEMTRHRKIIGNLGWQGGERPNANFKLLSSNLVLIFLRPGSICSFNNLSSLKVINEDYF